MKETKKNNQKRPLERHICPLERPTDGPSSPASLPPPLCRSLWAADKLCYVWAKCVCLPVRWKQSAAFLSGRSPASCWKAKNLWFGKLNFSVKAHWCLVMKLGIPNCFRFSGDTLCTHSLPVWVLKTTGLKTVNEYGILFANTLDKHLIEGAVLGYLL